MLFTEDLDLSVLEPSGLIQQLRGSEEERDKALKRVLRTAASSFREYQDLEREGIFRTVSEIAIFTTKTSVSYLLCESTKCVNNAVKKACEVKDDEIFKLNQMIQTLQQRVDNAQNEIFGKAANSESERAQQEEELGRLRRQDYEKGLRIDELQVQLANLQQGMGDANAMELYSQIDDLKHQLESKKAEIEDHLQRDEEKELELETEKAENINLRLKNESLTKDYDRMKQEKNENEEEMRKMRQDIDEKEDIHIDDMNELKKANAQLEDEIHVLRNQLDEREDIGGENFKNLYEKTKKELDIQGEEVKAMIAKHQDELSRKDDEIDELKDKCELLQLDNDDLKKKLDRQAALVGTGKLSRYGQGGSLSVEQNSSDEYERMRQMLNDTENELKELKASNIKSKKEDKDINKRLEQLERENAELLEKIRQLEAEIDKNLSTIDTLEQEYREEKAKVDVRIYKY
ncbi:MAG: hypothetical protein EZS28_022694 [Streblomastix strix]|uniref:Uncharacterized protein n=1 Tax=Streblomastix strix TaxID=222440 RepID=A0A5J4VHE3_9EUKA|nr:MAG: hypothetical protein EZS28_022694 [Streblomastix strix]